MSTDPKTLGKRAACDRCRTQKLRCVRASGQMTDTCIRCARSQLQCISSSSKRPGRPRNSISIRRGESIHNRPQYSSHHQDDGHQQARSPINGAAGGQNNILVPTGQHVEATSPTSTAAEDISFPALSNLNIQPLAGVDDWFLEGLLENEDDVNATAWTAIDPALATEDMGTINTISTISDPSEGNSATNSLNGLMPDSATDLSDHVSELKPTTSTEQSCYEAMDVDRSSRAVGGPERQVLSLSNPPPSPTLQQTSSSASMASFDHGLHFSVLQRDLSKQLFTLRSMSWDVTQIMRLTCGHDLEWSCPGDLDQERNPLARIVKSSNEFARLLCSAQTPVPSSSSDGRRVSSSHSDASLHSIHPQMSTADLLTVLSCHLITLSVFDFLIAQFINQALQNPNAARIYAKSTPKLYLGGIAVPPQLDTLGHLLCCVIGNHIRPIELLLGLPRDYCVSVSSDANNLDKADGLFGGSSKQMLFAALMKVEAERLEEGTGGLGVIESVCCIAI